MALPAVQERDSQALAGMPSRLCYKQGRHADTFRWRCNRGDLISMRVFILLAVLVIAGCASTPLEAIVTEQKLAGWKVGSQKDLGRGRGTIVELIPASESIDQWQQLATIQFFEGEHRTPQVVMRALETSMKTRCPTSTEWRVSGEELHSVPYEWRIHSCTGQDNQTEISRILQGNDGLHRIAYTEKETQ
jgi:hypothetical protein